MPEGTANFGQVCFVEEGAVAGRLQIQSANFHVESVFLGRDQEICTVAAQLAIDLVADIGGDGDHGGGYGNTERDRDAGEKFAARLAAERFVDEAREHSTFVRSSGCRPLRPPPR